MNSHNATYATTFAFANGLQSAKTDLTLHDPMPWVVALALDQPDAAQSNLQQMAYQAVWLSLVQQLLGRFNGKYVLSTLAAGAGQI